MIPTKTEEIKVSGNLTGKKVYMGLDPAAAKHLMSLLTDLYSDPALAVIREYSTNALDSHVEAGQIRPIEITTPTGLDRHFRVRDYGVGLSEQDIEEIFSQYGTSTKRETNDQTGMLGLGCKSALTFSQQFYINAIKDGVACNVIVYRDEDGQGIMDIIDIARTPMGNGVEIVIPAPESGDFQKKVERFFKFWDPSKVRIDGRPPRFPENAIKLRDGLFLIPTGDDYDRYNNNSRDIVVMGNVPYPVKNDHAITLEGGGYYRNYYVVAHLEMGEVSFTPSREELLYTDQTSAKLREIRREVNTLFTKVMQADIESANTHPEAFEKWMNWKKLNVRLPHVYYRGEQLTDQWDHEYVDFTPLKGARRQCSRIVGINYQRFFKAGVVPIINFPGDLPSRTQREKVKYWWDLKGGTGVGYPSFLLFQQLPGSPWTDGVEAHDWNEIVKIKLPSSGKATIKHKAVADKYDAVVDGTFRYNVDLDPSKVVDLVYVSPTVKRGGMHYNQLAEVLKGSTIVVIPKNRHDKFKRDYPHARSAAEAVNQLYMVAVKTSSRMDKLHRGIVDKTRTYEFCSMLDESRVDDPTIKRLIQIAKYRPSGNVSKITKAQTALNGPASVSDDDLRENPGAFPWDDYPLVPRWSQRGLLEDIYIYINTKYKERNAK